MDKYNPTTLNALFEYKNAILKIKQIQQLLNIICSTKPDQCTLVKYFTVIVSL